MIKTKIIIRYLNLLLILIILITSSCASKNVTKTINPMNESEKAGIKKVAVVIGIKEGLDVNISGSKNRFWHQLVMVDPLAGCTDSIACIFLPVFWLGLVSVSAITEETIRHSKDKSKESKFEDDLINHSLDKIISENIVKYIRNGNPEIEADVLYGKNNTENFKNSAYDSILYLDIMNFELNLCPKQAVYGYVSKEETTEGLGPPNIDDAGLTDDINRWNYIKNLHHQKKFQKGEGAYLYGIDTNIESEELDLLEDEIDKIKPKIEEYDSDHVRIWITFNGKLTSTNNNHTIWEKLEVFYDPKCENVNSMKNDSDLVIDMVIRSADKLALNLVEEVF